MRARHDDGSAPICLLQGRDNGRHLNCFGACADHCQNFFHHTLTECYAHMTSLGSRRKAPAEINCWYLAIEGNANNERRTRPFYDEIGMELRNKNRSAAFRRRCVRTVRRLHALTKYGRWISCMISSQRAASFGFQPPSTRPAATSAWLFHGPRTKVRLDCT